MGIRFQQIDGAVRIPVRVQPRASRTELAGEHDGALKVRVAAPPVDGKANEELLGFLSRTLSVPKRAVSVVSGESGRQKVVEVEGLDVRTVGRLLTGEASG